MTAEILINHLTQCSNWSILLAANLLNEFAWDVAAYGLILTTNHLSSSLSFTIVLFVILIFLITLCVLIDWSSADVKCSNTFLRLQENLWLFFFSGQGCHALINWTLHFLTLFSVFLPAATKLWPRLCFYSCLWFCPRGGLQQGEPPLVRRPPAGRAPWQGDPPW